MAHEMPLLLSLYAPRHVHLREEMHDWRREHIATTESLFNDLTTMEVQRNRHALPPSVAMRGAIDEGGVILPKDPMTRRPRMSVDAHFMGDDIPLYQQASSGSSSSHYPASSTDDSAFVTTVEDIDVRDHDDESGSHTICPAPLPAYSVEQRDTSLFQHNELWNKVDESGEIYERQVSRLSSVTEAMDAVSRGVKRKMSWWFRKDSAAVGVENITTQDDEVELETDDSDDVLVSCSDEEVLIDPRVACDGAPLARCTNTRASGFVDSNITNSMRGALRFPTARPVLPPVQYVGNQVRKFSSSACAGIIKTPPQHIITHSWDDPCHPADWAKLLQVGVASAAAFGRFDDGRRDKQFHTAFGNNTNPAAQWKASMKLVLRAKREKTGRDRLFANRQRNQEYERLCGDVQKRSWRWRIARGRSQVRLPQVWYQRRTLSEPGREETLPTSTAKAAVRCPAEEVTTIVGNVMRQQASTVGIPLTP